MQNHLKEILTALADARVNFVVAGGVAVLLHGVERVTMDLDLALQLSRENLTAFQEAIGKLGLKPRVPVSPESLADPVTVQRFVEEKGALVFTFLDHDKPIRQLDIFLTKGLSFERLLGDAIEIELDGRPIKVASLERMLEIKKGIPAPRDKDLMDIRELERIKQRKGAG